MDNIEAAKYIKAHCLGNEVCRDGTRWNDAMVTAVEALEQAPTFDWLMKKADEWGMVYGKQFLIEAQRAWKEGKDIDVPTNSALDHIHNVVADNAFGKGYDAGYKEGYERGRKDTATSLAMRITTRFDEVLGVEDVLEEIDNLLAVPKGE